MKKATLLVIGVIYIASIVIVSIFGLKAVVYDAVIPVVSIECVNKTEGKVQVGETQGKKVISVEYTEPGSIDNPEGTTLQLDFRVLPDNATDKGYKFVYAREQYPQVTFFENSQGETGLVFFTAPALFTLQVWAIDGTSVHTEVIISCR